MGAGVRARGGTAYVFGKPVCARCASTLIQAGISIVVAAEPMEGAKSKWDRSGLLGRQMMKEANVAFEPTFKGAA